VVLNIKIYAKKEERKNSKKWRNGQKTNIVIET